MNELEPISPREAYRLYRNDCEGELSPRTIEARDYRLGFFLRWCESKDDNGDPHITNLNEISGRDIYKYRTWRKQDIKPVTLKAHISDLRQFMKFCVTIDAVPSSIPDKVGNVVLDYDENINDDHIIREKAEAIIEYLEKYHYASKKHVLFLLPWKTAARIGGLHGLDVDDFDWENKRVSFAHRPDSRTYLKNKRQGERSVALEDDVLGVIRDYINNERLEVKDDYDRRPLFTSRAGRMSKGHLSKYIYYVTTPCITDHECPDERRPSQCEFTSGIGASVGCPYNNPSHDIRRGAVTRWLQNDVPEKAIGDRVHMSTDTLDKHYDKRTSDEKAEQRRGFFD